MPSYYTRAHITIDCSLEQGKQIIKALSFIEDNLRDFLCPITASDLAERTQTAKWQDLALKLVPKFSNALMEEERDDLYFNYTLALPQVQGRQVMDPQKFKGLCLFGDNIEDDLFEITRVILDTLDSDQVISVGIAHTADKATDESYGGDYVVITRHGWETCINGFDRTALEQSMVDRAGYWVVQYSLASAAHPHAFVAILPDEYDETQVAETLIDQLCGVSLPETFTTVDLLLAPVPASTFRHLEKALPVHDLNPNSTATEEAAA